MRFDPNAVVKYECEYGDATPIPSGGESNPDETVQGPSGDWMKIYTWVAASDYDRLLALYTAEVEGRKDDALESRANAERWSD